MRLRHRSAIVLGVALLLVHCGGNPKPYVTVGKVALTVSTTLQAASDAADAAYAQRDVTGFDGKQLNRTREILEPLAIATLAAERALASLPAGTIAAPPSLDTLATALENAAVEILNTIAPSPTRVALIGFIHSASAAVQAMRAVFAAAISLPTAVLVGG